MATSVDPQLRLQNIALEHAELVARRSMNWSETANRTTMFMSVLGAAVVGLALFAQVSGVEGVRLLALVILAVVLVVGITTAVRLSQLDVEDMHLIQGLNRLRHMRLELDPGLSPYLVTSPHDDFDSILRTYAPDNAPAANGSATLVVLVLIVNAVLFGVVGGLVAVNLGADATISLVVGAIAFVGLLVAAAVWFARTFRTFSTSFVSLVPAHFETPSPDAVGTTKSDNKVPDRATATD